MVVCVINFRKMFIFTADDLLHIILFTDSSLFCIETCMKSKLIADAGSTNVEWTLLDTDGKVAQSFTSDGLNALLSSQEAIENAFQQVRGMISADSFVEEIHYYGAGCATPYICDKVKAALQASFFGAECHVNSDLLAAARSLLGNKKGIACIIGTGSNSCLYDGVDIISQIPSLGYVLGDEGSGAALGKCLVSDALKEQLPVNIKEEFFNEYKLTLPDILENVYRKPAPNKFLASFVPFIAKNLWNPYIYSLVLKELTKFVKRNVAMYNGANSLDICFTGSIAFHFEKILREAAASVGYKVSEVTSGPMKGLIAYHIGNQ